MKKILVLMMTGLMLLGIFSFNVSAQENIHVYVEGEKITFDVSPQIINGRTMVPIRAIAEKLNINIQWVPSDKVVKMQTNTKEISMYIGSNWCECNKYSIFLDSPPIIQDGRTLVPLRFIAEQLNMKVDWDGIKKRIDIHSIGDTTYDTIQKEYVEDGVNYKKVYTGELINGVPYGVGKLEIFSEGDKIQETVGCFYNSVIKGYAEVSISDIYQYGGFFDEAGDLTDGYSWAKFGDSSYLEGTFYSNEGECHYYNVMLDTEYWGTGKFIEDNPFASNGGINAPFSLVADGYGKMNSNGTVYEGNFTEGVLNGYGTINYINGLRYEGDIVDFLPNGYGIIYYKNGNIAYCGTFKEGKQSGNGKQYYENGNLEYDGAFEDGKIKGYGKSYYPDGTIEYEGYFE